jgi:hypothetical protein
MESVMDPPDAAGEIARTARLIQEARDLQSRNAPEQTTDQFINGSRRRLALSRALLAKPVCHPFKDWKAKRP